MTTETLFAQYNVPIAHTRHVADMALALFDSLQPVHGLPNKVRDLMEVGALLHDIAVVTDPDKHNIVGRDIVLRADLAGLDENKRAIVACMVAFHRKKVRPDSEPAYLRLSKKDRAAALALAALLRIADGLDYCHTQKTRIINCDIGKKEITLSIDGPHADEDSARAMKKADLWNRMFESQIRVVVGPNVAADTAPNVPDTLSEQGKDIAPQTKSSSPEKSNGNGIASVEHEQLPQTYHEWLSGNRWASITTLHVDEHTLTEMGRSLMRQNLRKLLDCERDARKDSDIEAVHQMRVATRRLRAMLPVMEAVAPVEQCRFFRKAIRKTARALADVRDFDVFQENIAAYVENLPKEQQSGMAPLVNALKRDRAIARKRMLSALDSQAYITFKREFSVFMTDNAEHWNKHLRVQDLAGSAIWRCYELLRAYETWLDMRVPTNNDIEDLHTMRISGKRLRYMLELFGDKSAAWFAPVYEPLVQLQNCLGILQDVAVAKDYVATLEVDKAHERAALDVYVANRDAEHARQLEKLPNLWENIASDTYRRNLFELILVL